MRTLTLLLISVAVVLSATESNPRMQRVLDNFESTATSAEETYQEAIRAAEQARAKSLSDGRDRALRDLKRLVNRRSDVAEQAEVYTQVLRLDREDEDAVRFFSAIGTLEQVLAGLEPLIETDLLGNPTVGGAKIQEHQAIPFEYTFNPQNLTGESGFHSYADSNFSLLSNGEVKDGFRDGGVVGWRNPIPQILIRPRSKISRVRIHALGRDVGGGVNVPSTIHIKDANGNDLAPVTSNIPDTSGWIVIDLNAPVMSGVIIEMTRRREWIILSEIELR